MAGLYDWLAGEPHLNDLLADPIMDLMLRRDGLTVEDIWAVIDSARTAPHAETSVAEGA